jgi:hypothetical protein
MSSATLPIFERAYREIDVSTAPQDVVVEKTSDQLRWRVKPTTSVTSMDDFSADESEIPTWAFRLTAEGINATLRSVETVNEDAENEDEYATTFALAFALNLIKRAGALLTTDVPTGWASLDFNRGIRITWRRKDREIRLSIPAVPTGRAYIYSLLDASSDISDDLSTDALASRLKWLTQD